MCAFVIKWLSAKRVSNTIFTLHKQIKAIKICTSKILKKIELKNNNRYQRWKHNIYIKNHNKIKLYHKYQCVMFYYVLFCVWIYEWKLN